MNILVFTAIKNLYLNTLAAIHQLEHEGPLAWLQLRDNPSPDPRENVTRAYNAARTVFLAGDYDALLTVENDVVPPRDALCKLLFAEADVAYGLYCYRQPGHLWNAYLFDGQSLVMQPDLARQAWGQVVPVQGYGLGCALIRRHVLEQIEFRFDPDQPGLHCDSHFGDDVRAAYMNQVCDTSVLCGHIINEHRMVYPDVAQNPTVTGAIEWRFYRYEWGLTPK